MESAFSQAQLRVKQLSKTPTPQELLQLYALFKQATTGDASGPRPGVFEVRARAKYDAWAKEKGIGSAEAEARYIELVDSLVKKYD